MDFQHTSVLLTEAVEGLNINPNGIYVDGTLGGGGHSAEIAKKLSQGRLLCIDRDRDAIEEGKRRLFSYSNVSFYHDNFTNSAEILKGAGIDHVNGILLDLGVSSYQIDTMERGFSYMKEDAPLDMRMDRSMGQTAADILLSYEEDELSFIFKTYGEEKFARKIAKAIVTERQKKPLQTAGDLNDLIRACVPSQQKKGHPSKRVYQALRIEVNNELKPLEQTISQMIDLLAPQGRICVITFHSLEDRIVKQCFKNAQNPCTCPPDFPVCVCGKQSKGNIVTRKPILPSDKECENNARAKSAKLRIFERSI